MAASANPIATAVGAIAGSAVSSAAAPVSGIVGVISSLVNKALDFIPDPQQKLALQQHALDLQAQAASEELDAITKQAATAATMAQGDKSLWWVRSFFCVTITLLYVWNYAGCRFFHQSPYDFPTTLHFIFAGIMLGLTGAPTALQALQNVVGMVPGVMQLPGDSQVSVLGVKIGNKS
jgi:hypothetical protein